MSKLVLVSDIHGNYPSLQAVVDKEGTDVEYIVLGDIHGLLAYPQETQTMVQTLDGVTLAGNHDKALFHYGEGHVNNDALSEFELEHTMAALSPEQQEWVEELPFLEVVQRVGQRICLCHAYPWVEKASGYERGNAGVRKNDVVEIASVVADSYDYVFHGHTHTQYSLDCSKFGHDVHFVNPGSLGYQQEYAVVDVATGNVDLKEVEYDADVQSHIQDALPEGAPHTAEWF